MPAERAFATKGELARALALRALASARPTAWVTAGSLYGQEWRFRRTLEEAQVDYVLAVPKPRPAVVQRSGRLPRPHRDRRHPRLTTKGTGWSYWTTFWTSKPGAPAKLRSNRTSPPQGQPSPSIPR
ncbi:transposase [Streptomyces sp. NBC_00322]|nr:transposase [Streptomyces sp. NBC_00322]